MDERQLMSLTEAQNTIAIVLPPLTVTDGTHLTCYDFGDVDRLSLQLW